MTIDPGFTTQEMRRVFSAESRISLMCRFESALAEAQAELGIVPAQAARAIANACSNPRGDADAILRRGWETGTPVLALLDDLRTGLSEEDGRWLHHGATTQDVADTALMLQCQAALQSLDGDLTAAADRLAELADVYRETAALARTFYQPAVTTSFGSRVAGWLHPLVLVRRDSRRLSERLPIQLGGPVGDLVSYGDGAFTLGDRVAARLGLVGAVPWHTDRWPVQEVAGLLARAASACSKIATDVAVLAADGEVRVRSGRSSSMSGKENPVDAMRSEAAAQVCKVVVSGLVAPPSHVLERGMGPWHAEWALIPLAFQTAGASAAAIALCLDSLEVGVEAMKAAAGGEAPADAGLIERVVTAHRELEG
ncbi:MAG TPA: lyase family protein [Acidimicrobiia bacterium]|nr:lyase family protein [Acidimicrobiia bacterium]